MPGRWSQPSLLRGLLGWVSMIASLVVLVMSAVMLVRALEYQGYGSPGMVSALIWMSTAGALLATGVALLIWEYSVRWDIPR